MIQIMLWMLDLVYGGLKKSSHEDHHHSDKVEQDGQENQETPLHDNQSERFQADSQAEVSPPDRK